MTNPIVTSTLADLHELDEQVKAGKLKPAEAKEIAADMLSVERIHQLTNDLNEQSELIKAFEGLEQVANALFTVI